MEYTDLIDNARPLRADASPLGISGMTSVGYTDVRGQVMLAFYLDDRLRRTLPLKDDEQERFERTIVPALDQQLEADAEAEAKAKAEAEAKAASEAAAKAKEEPKPEPAPKAAAKPKPTRRRAPAKKETE